VRQNLTNNRLTCDTIIESLIFCSCTVCIIYNVNWCRHARILVTSKNCNYYCFWDSESIIKALNWIWVWVWVWVWKISPKNVKFFNFFSFGSKKVSSGRVKKYSGWPLIYFRSKVSLGRVKAHIHGFFGPSHPKWGQTCLFIVTVVNLCKLNSCVSYN